MMEALLVVAIVVATWGAARLWHGPRDPRD